MKYELLAKLSDSERSCFDLLVQGMNTSEIAKRLSLAYGEVAQINRTIKHKLEVETVRDLRKLAGAHTDVPAR